MANQANKTEHSGAKKGKGAYWGRKKSAKHESNKVRREDDKVQAGQMTEKSIDSYHYHEALDRTFIQLCNLESTLGEHPVILSDQTSIGHYEKAVESLAALYQRLGEIGLEK
jgi:hypothetical protein